MTEIKIAAAASTPVYLPLYLARYRDYYGHLPKDFSLDIITAPPDVGDADQWVHDRVSASGTDYLFGVCDPHKAFDAHYTKVIAALVTKAAFWAINTTTRFVHLSDAHKFPRIITYPKGMTGYLLYERTRDAGREVLREYDPTPVECEI